MTGWMSSEFLPLRLTPERSGDRGEGGMPCDTDKKEKLMRRKSRTVFALAMLLLAPGALTVADSAFGEEQNKVKMAAAAKITIDEAIKTASEKVSGKVIEAALEGKHHTLVWEVEIVTPEDKVMEVHIHAETGAVIDIEEEKAKSGRLRRPRS
jgi:uncharacterized membrane protein YkoI